MIINFSNINFPLNLRNEKNNDYLNRLYVNNKVKYSLNIKNLYKNLKNGENIKNKGNIIKLLHLYKNNIYNQRLCDINTIDNIHFMNKIDNTNLEEILYYNDNILKLYKNLYFDMSSNKFYLQSPKKHKTIINSIHLISNNYDINKNIYQSLAKNININININTNIIKYKYYNNKKYKVITNTNLIIVNKFMAKNSYNCKKICTQKQLKNMKIKDLLFVDSIIITYECIKSIITDHKLFLDKQLLTEKSIELCYKKDILNSSCFYFFAIYWNNIIFENINSINNNKIIELLSQLECKKKYLLSHNINDDILRMSYNISTGNKIFNNDLYKKYINKHVFIVNDKNKKEKENKKENFNFREINCGTNNMFKFINEYYGENIYDNNLQIIYSLINIYNSNIIKKILVNKNKLIKFYKKNKIVYDDKIFTCSKTTCSICYTNFPINNYCFLYCGHYFCTSCFINILNFNNYQCPLCRNKFNYKEYYIINTDIQNNFYKINECLDIIKTNEKYVIISKWKNVIDTYLTIFKKKGIDCEQLCNSNNTINKFNKDKLKICMISKKYLEYNYELNCKNFIILDPFCIDKKAEIISELRNKSIFNNISINILYTKGTIEEIYVNIIRDLI
jgi:hypothetical protein